MAQDPAADTDDAPVQAATMDRSGEIYRCCRGGAPKDRSPKGGTAETRAGEAARWIFVTQLNSVFPTHCHFRFRGDFLIFVLQLVELVVNAALGQQLLMRSNFAQLALVHDDDFIGALNS